MKNLKVIIIFFICLERWLYLFKMHTYSVIFLLSFMYNKLEICGAQKSMPITVKVSNW